jgi:hypothetical protein
VIPPIKYQHKARSPFHKAKCDLSFTPCVRGSGRFSSPAKAYLRQVCLTKRSVRVLHIGHPLPSLFELKDMIGSVAGIAVGLGIAPQAMARLLLTSVPPWQSVVLAIDDADTLPRQSLCYLAQLSNALAGEAPVLQIVLAAGPGLLELLNHPDFETFRNRIVVSSQNDSEQKDDRMKS